MNKKTIGIIVGALAIVAALAWIFALQPKAGFERVLDMSTAEAFRKSLDEYSITFTDEQVLAWQNVIASMEYEQLAKKYTGKTPREILLAETNADLATVARIVKTQAERDAQSEKLEAELLKNVVSEDIKASLSSDFFGPKMVISYTVKNQSSQDFGSLTWSAALYLDDEAEPVATGTILNDYSTDRNGLMAGETVQASASFNSFHDQDEWYSPLVRHAKSRKVVLTLDAGESTDLGGQRLLTEKQDIVRKTGALEYKVKLDQALTVAKAKPVSCLLGCPQRAIEQAKTEESSSSQSHSVDRSRCSNSCVNGACVRTFPDGTKENWQAERKFDPMSGDWQWDTNGCGG